MTLISCREVGPVSGMAGTPQGNAGPIVQVRLPVRAGLPVGGWQAAFRVQPDGRTVVEVTDAGGSLAGLVASTRLPLLSIDAGWRGSVPVAGRGRQWWVLAIGHAPAREGRPVVTFTRRARRGGRGHAPRPPDTVDGLWIAHDGLWVAAASGRYMLVRLSVGSTTCVQRLHPVKPVMLNC